MGEDTTPSGTWSIEPEPPPQACGCSGYLEVKVQGGPMHTPLFSFCVIHLAQWLLAQGAPIKMVTKEKEAAT